MSSEDSRVYNRDRVNSRSNASNLFRQSTPAICLSIERATDRVSDDGFFYVILHDEVRGKFKNKRQALDLYQQLRKESGYTPPLPARTPERNEAIERYLDDLERYWDQSHKHAKRGGKGRF